MRRLILLAVVCGSVGCENAVDSPAIREARHLIADNCATCHVVPGIARARGRVGPSLAGIAHQQIIAGHFANTPQQLARWIEHPQQMLPGDAMPEMGLSEAQARSIALYLYTLE
jgi:cytochrome c2